MKVDIKYKNSTVAELTNTGITKLNTENKYVSAPIVIDVVEAGIPTGDATATAADILSPKTAYIADGTKATGTIPTKSAETFTASTSDQVIDAGQYLGGAQTIKAVSLNANADNMLSGTSASIMSNGGTVVSIFGTIPTWAGEKSLTDCLCFTANTAGSTVSMQQVGTPTLNQNFQYNISGRSAWKKFTPGTTTITLTNAGDKVYFRGNNSFGVNQSTSIYYKFVMTGSIAASGNIMSLVDNGECACVTVPNENCFRYLFRECTALTSSPSLPATSLSYNCYAYMFFNCTSLISPPQILPATTLTEKCYSNMFAQCSAMINAPELPSTNLAPYCYEDMFRGCSALVTAPALPATTLSSRCYQNMFYACESLTTAPTLPATRIEEGSYYFMFYYCTSLTTPPRLPATIVDYGGYSYMFKYCTSLIVSDTPGEGYTNEWRFPTAGQYDSRYTDSQTEMFQSCAGTRSSSALVTYDHKVYYTQNPPV